MKQITDPPPVPPSHKRTFMSVIAISLVLLPPFVPTDSGAQECLSFEDYTQRSGYVDISNDCGRGLAAIGNVVYVPNQDTDIQIVDVSDPSQPVIVSSFEVPGWPRDIAVVDDYAYVLSFGETDPLFLVLDVSDPLQPEYVTGRALPVHGAMSVAAAGDRAYVGGVQNVTRDTYRGWVQVVDIANRSDPQIAGFVWMPSVQNQHSDARRISAEGNLAVVAARHAGVQLVDASDPLEPEIIGAVSSIDHVWDADLSGGYVYTAGGGVHVIDVTTPADPQVVTATGIGCGHHAANIEVQDGMAYVTCYESYLHCLDVTQPDSPLDTGFVQLQCASFHHDMIVEGGVVLPLCGDGLVSFDAAPPMAPAVITQVTDFGDLVLVDSLAGCTVAVDGSGGLHFLDDSEPLQPELIGTWIPPDGHAFDPVDLAVRDNLVVVTWDHGFYLVDITDLANPTTAAVQAMPGEKCHAAIDGDHVFTTWTRYVGGFEDEGGLRIFDVGNPAAPTLVFEKFYELFVANVDTYRGRIYVSTAFFIEGSVEIFDIREPWAPTLLRSVDVLPAFYHSGLVFAGDVAYAMSGPYGIQVLNLNELSAAPPILASMSWDMDARNAVTSGDYLYVADPEEGVHVVDVSNPQQPLYLGSGAICGGARDLAVRGNYLCTASGDAGLSLLLPQCGDSLPNVMAVEIHGGQDEMPGPGLGLHVYPNPFNPQITIEIRLDREQWIDVGIYDLRGARIRAISTGHHGPGEPVFTWDGRAGSGRPMPSGTYIVRLVTGEQVTARQVMLVR